MTDDMGAIQARYDYDPYGRLTKISGSLDTDFGFTGFFSQADTGLSFAQFRAYDPGLGRWLSRDPSGENSGVNLYAYAGNPLNATDPLGLWSFDFGVAAGLGARITIGHNGGRWSISATGGVGLGWTVGLNPNDQGANNMKGPSMKYGFRAQGSADAGMIGLGVGGGWTTEGDLCGNYDTKMFVDGSVSMKGIDKGYSGFGKIGGEVGMRESGNFNDPASAQLKGYAKSTGSSYSLGAMGIAGVLVGASW